MMRIPAKLFKDYSEKGSLVLILRKVFEYKQESHSRRFDFQSPVKRPGHIELFLMLEDALIKAGFLKRPKIHIHESVSSEERAGLVKILAR